MKSSKIFNYEGIEIDVSVNYAKSNSYFNPAHTLSVKNGGASVNYDGRAIELIKEGKSLMMRKNNIKYKKGNTTIYKHVNKEELEGLIKEFMELDEFKGLSETLIKFDEEKELQEYMKSESELLFAEL